LAETGTPLDVLQYAAQIGRLDFLTAVLAGLALIIGLGTFPLISFLRIRAERAAREEARSATRQALENVEALAVSKIEEQLPILIEEYLELAKNAASRDMANQIAAAQEDGPDETKTD